MRVPAGHDRDRARRPRARHATALRATWDLPGPVYYRLGKDDTHRACRASTAASSSGRAELVRERPRRAASSRWAASPREAAAAADTLAARGRATAGLPDRRQPAARAGRRPRRGAVATSRSRSRSRRTTRRAGSARWSPRSSPSAASGCRVRPLRRPRPRPTGVSGSQALPASRAHGLTSRALVERRPALAAAVRRRCRRDERRAGLGRPAGPQPGGSPRDASCASTSSGARPRCRTPYELVLVPNACRTTRPAICQRARGQRTRASGSWRASAAAGAARCGWGSAPRAATSSATRTPRARRREELALLLALRDRVPGRGREGEPQDPRALAPAPRLAALQPRVPRAVRPVELGRQRHAEGLPARTSSSCSASTRDDDLIDAEFNLICRREGYPMVEVPIFSHAPPRRALDDQPAARRCGCTGARYQLWRAQR